MDLIETAVVDLTMLIATCRVLRVHQKDRERGARPEWQRGLRGEIRRGTKSYLGTLAHSSPGDVDSEVLARCRVAAEREMKKALQAAPALCQLMNTESGALSGFTAVRHDLWRLSRIAMHLPRLADAWRHTPAKSHRRAAQAAIERLQRNLRRAWVGYARACMRSPARSEHVANDGRRGALSRLPERCFTDAERLLRWMGQDQAGATEIERCLVQPLRDIATDWNSSNTSASSTVFDRHGATSGATQPRPRS